LGPAGLGLAGRRVVIAVYAVPKFCIV